MLASAIEYMITKDRSRMFKYLWFTLLFFIPCIIVSSVYLSNDWYIEGWSGKKQFYYVLFVIMTAVAGSVVFGVYIGSKILRKKF